MHLGLLLHQVMEEPLEEDEVGVPKVSTCRCILLNDYLLEKSYVTL
jgi:hypothetical protein